MVLEVRMRCATAGCRTAEQIASLPLAPRLEHHDRSAYLTAYRTVGNENRQGPGRTWRVLLHGGVSDTANRCARTDHWLRSPPHAFHRIEDSRSTRTFGWGHPLALLLGSSCHPYLGILSLSCGSRI